MIDTTLDPVTQTRHQVPGDLPDTVGLWDGRTNAEVQAGWHERQHYAFEMRWEIPKRKWRPKRLPNWLIVGCVVFNKHGKEIRRLTCERLVLYPGDSLTLNVALPPELQ